MRRVVSVEGFREAGMHEWMYPAYPVVDGDFGAERLDEVVLVGGRCCGNT